MSALECALPARNEPQRAWSLPAEGTERSGPRSHQSNPSSMPKRTLTEFLDTHRAGAHLVAGVPPRSHGDENLRTQARKLVRAVEFGKPSGDYAVGVVRETGRPQLYCAFQDQADAQ